MERSWENPFLVYLGRGNVLDGKKIHGFIMAGDGSRIYRDRNGIIPINIILRWISGRKNVLWNHGILDWFGWEGILKSHS